MPCIEVGVSPKGLTPPQNKTYAFTFHGLVCVTIQYVRYYKMRALIQNACATTNACAIKKCLRY